MIFDRFKKRTQDIRTLKLIYGESLINNYFALSNKRKVTDSPVHYGNILVIAPHQGDDIIGLGGSLKLHVNNNDRVKVIYITDGSQSFPSEYRATAKEKKDMIGIREEEAKKSMEIIDIEDYSFLRYKQRGFNANDNSVKYLYQQIEAFDPSLIYVPYFLDTDPDNQQVLEMVDGALNKTDKSPKLAMYEVWTPLIPNQVVSIDNVSEVKEKALSVHRSQSKSHNYLYAAMGLSAYRGSLSGVGNYAEAFLVLDKQVFKKLYKKISVVKV